MNLLAFDLAALVPTMIGPLPQQTQAGLVAGLCSGAGGVRVTVTIPLRNRPALPEPCHQKGCHAGCSRKKFDRDQ